MQSKGAFLQSKKELGFPVLSLHFTISLTSPQMQLNSVEASAPSPIKLHACTGLVIFKLNNSDKTF